ncbi:acyl carrier protein [Trinickia diaoshuihuensis]|jgi:polyketide biosynthesis acyl carrier protein|uniref:acyl carrier protein n=1 Tax=Trinickia diaoshuihuensis TaxID=2292265 RepID=UPI000E265737|nr:acyl carrier protein [Trinickia diaoshuihuensis]
MTREDVFQLIADRAREVLPDLKDHVFKDSDRLRDLGANSLDRAEIAMLVLESLSLTIARVELFGPSNVGELADLIHSRLEARAA